MKWQDIVHEMDYFGAYDLVENHQPVYIGKVLAQQDGWGVWLKWRDEEEDEQTTCIDIPRHVEIDPMLEQWRRRPEWEVEEGLGPVTLERRETAGGMAYLVFLDAENQLPENKEREGCAYCN